MRMGGFWGVRNVLLLFFFLYLGSFWGLGVGNWGNRLALHCTIRCIVIESRRANVYIFKASWESREWTWTWKNGVV